MAHSRVWAAFSALGPAEWFSQLLNHLLTIALDYGPGFVLVLLTWIVFDRFGLRDAKYAVLVGVVSFYLAPRLYALLFLLQTAYWSPYVFPDLLAPELGEIVAGAVLALLMWAIAYWKPTRSATGGAVA